MSVLIVGLVIFLGVHSLRLVGLRDITQRLVGPALFAIIYSLLSAVGLALIVYGHILAHPGDTVWLPPEWTRSVALIAVPVSLVLLVAAYVPSHIRSVLRHPMTIATLIWSVAHLLANGEWASVILFGSFAVWSLLTLIEAYWRGGVYASAGNWSADAVAIGLGLLASAAFAYFHMQLFGVAIIEFASETPPPGI